MEVSPRSPRRIKESTSSSSSELQPIINPDDRRSLQVRDEISALEQQQQRLCDCDRERILLQREIHALLELVDNSGLRLQLLEDGASSNAARLRTCLQKIKIKRIESAEAEDVVKVINKNLEHFEMVERRQNEQMAKLSAEIESLQKENTDASIGLHISDLEAEALEEDIKHLEKQLLEESNCLPPIENMNISPASERKPSGM